MALRIDAKYKGITVPGAYATAVMPSISTGKNEISFGLWYRASEDSAEIFDAVTLIAPYDLDGENPFRQAYDHLKSLPEFAGAIDC